MAPRLTFPVGIAIEAIDNATAKTRAIVGGISKATSPLRRLGTSISGLSEAAQFPKLLDGFRGVGSAIGDVGNAARRAALLVGGIAVAAGAATFALVKGFAEAGDSAFKGAQKVGISVEALQELRYAAELADVANEELDMSLVKLTRNAALAARGQKTAAVPFERLGIAVLDVNGKIRPANELLAEIADKFQNLDDPLKRAALAMEFFGKSGANLIPLLSGGAKGLADSAAEARGLGIVLSRDAAQGGETFNDSLTRVGAAVRGIRNAIGAELLPILLELSNRFRVWVMENLPRIRAFAVRLAVELPRAIARAQASFEKLWEKTEPVRMLFGKLYDALGPLGTGLAVLAGIVTVTVLPSVLSLVAALATLSVALVSTPAGWVVLALAGITVALAALAAGAIWAYRNWDELSARFPHAAALIERIAGGALVHLVSQLGATAIALEFVSELLAGLPDFVLGKIERVATIFELLWTSLRSGFGAVYDWIAGKLSALSGLVPDWLKTALVQGASLVGAGVGVAAGLVTGDGGRSTLIENAIDEGLQGRIAGPGAAAKSEAKVFVEFSNLPRGARVSSEEKGGAALDLSMGYALQTP